MKSKHLKLAMLLSIGMFIAGIIMILTSVNDGFKKGNDAIWNNGGSIETDKYNQIVESNIKNYQIVGSVIALVGGFGLIVSWHDLSQEER